MSPEQNGYKSVTEFDKARSTRLMPIIIVSAALLLTIILVLSLGRLVTVEHIDSGNVALIERPLVSVDRYGKVDSRNREISFDMSEENGGDIVVRIEDISENALFYTYNTRNGITMQLIFVLAPNGEVRVGLNTSEDCKGEPNSYFIQGEGVFKCIHCGYVVANAEVGTGTNSAAPIPIKFRENGDTVVIEEDDLLSSEDWFTNWEGPLG